jgi:hypothetical protein
VDSRLRRFPPNRASAVPYGQAMDNALRCPPLAHRSAAAHKLHSAQATIFQIRESQNHLSGTGLSLFHPGGCPSYRDHRTVTFDPDGRMHLAKPPTEAPTAWLPSRTERAAMRALVFGAE